MHGALLSCHYWKIATVSHFRLVWVGEPPQFFFQKSEGVGEIMLFYFKFDKQSWLSKQAEKIKSRETKERWWFQAVNGFWLWTNRLTNGWTLWLKIKDKSGLSCNRNYDSLWCLVPSPSKIRSVQSSYDIWFNQILKKLWKSQYLGHFQTFGIIWYHK